MYISKVSGHLSELTMDSFVADSAWHVLVLSSHGQNTLLYFDGQPALNITGRSMDLTPVNVRKIIIGAALAGDSEFQHSGEYAGVFPDNGVLPTYVCIVLYMNCVCASVDFKRKVKRKSNPRKINF